MPAFVLDGRNQHGDEEQFCNFGELHRENGYVGQFSEGFGVHRLWASDYFDYRCGRTGLSVHAIHKSELSVASAGYRYAVQWRDDNDKG